MAVNLFVGNLAWEATTDELYDLFRAHGRVRHAQGITDHGTGRSRGFGVVEMEDDAEARRAVAALGGQPFKGRPLSVCEARSRDDRGGETP